MRFATLLTTFTLISVTAGAQAPADAVKRGEALFAKTCGTGYCHATRGVGGGAPRLTARGFESAYIAATVRNGIPGTGMAAYGTSMPAADLAAVVAYVVSVNGIAPDNSSTAANGKPRALSAEAMRGRVLFSEATRSFGRCSTCHFVNGIGIAVATPIARIPPNAAALKAMATPAIVTATSDEEKMAALVLARRSQEVSFYDLTSVPPVLRTLAPAGVQITDANPWKHSTVIAGYSDAEIDAILTYLRAIARP
jgi:mono/diheme cytochrome c family protein